MEFQWNSRVHSLGNWIPCFELLQRSILGDMMWVIVIAWLSRYSLSSRYCQCAGLPSHLSSASWVLRQNWPAVWSGGIRRTPLMHETSIEELCQKYQQTSDTARFIAHQTTALAIVIIVIIYLNIFVIIVHMFPRVPSATSFRVRCAQPTSSGFLTQHSAKRS